MRNAQEGMTVFNKVRKKVIKKCPKLKTPAMDRFKHCLKLYLDLIQPEPEQTEVKVMLRVMVKVTVKATVKAMVKVTGVEEVVVRVTGVIK